MTLQIEGLNVSIMRNRVRHGVSLRVSPGELGCLVGRNGAGKTTTFRAIMGFEAIGGGQIFCRGKALTKLPTHGIAAAGLG